MVQSRKCTLSNEYWNWLSLRETAHRRARRPWSIFIGSLLPHWLIAFKCKSWNGGNKALFCVCVCAGWHGILLRFKPWIYFFWSSSNKWLRRKIKWTPFTLFASFPLTTFSSASPFPLPHPVSLLFARFPAFLSFSSLLPPLLSFSQASLRLPTYLSQPWVWKLTRLTEFLKP